MFAATRNIASKYGSKAASLGALALASVPAFAQGTDPVEQVFGGINLAAVSASVVAIGIIVMGIVMAYKGIDLGKRAVSKA